MPGIKGLKLEDGIILMKQKKDGVKLEKGRKISEETIAKIVAKTRGQKRSEEFKKHLSEIRKGENNYAFGKPAHNRGTHHTVESKAKMSASHKKMTDETRKNMSIASKNRIRFPCSEETKEKLHIKGKGRHYSPQSEFKMGHKTSMESKLKMSKSQKERWNKKTIMFGI